MSRYRKVDVALWSDAKFMALSQDAQLLWLFLLTGPMTTNIPGVVVAGPAALAEAMKWSAERFAERFQELSAKGMAKADFGTRIVWLPKAIKRNRPANLNVVKGWRETWGLVPECDLKAVIWHALKPYAEPFGEPFGELLPQPLPEQTGNGMATQEQEQEQEQEIVAAANGAGSPEFELQHPTPPRKPKRKRKPRPPRPPLPFQVADLIDAFERGAGGRFIADFDRALAKPLTELIRRLGESGKTLDDVEAAGCWVASRFSEPVSVAWLAKTGNLHDAIAKARAGVSGGPSRPSNRPPDPYDPDAGKILAGRRRSAR